MQRIGPIFFLFALGLTACAHDPVKADPVKKRETAMVLRASMDRGRSLAVTDPAIVQKLEDYSFGWLLLRGLAPRQGAARLQSLQLKDPSHPLSTLFMQKSLASSLPEADTLEDAPSDAFDPALFRPFFRQVLLAVVQGPSMDEAAYLAHIDGLDLAARLTPRSGGQYPNRLNTDLRIDLESYVKMHPQSVLADRMRMFLLWDERNGAWADRRARLDQELSRLAHDTKDELLRRELAEALILEQAKPERAFWWSLFLPGAGQVAQGDLQGGILLGGLTAAAWVWMGSKLAVAHASNDDAMRHVAYGDAAWAGTLALIGHGFTALNAADQARGFNVIAQWDLLSKDRLKAGLKAEEP